MSLWFVEICTIITVCLLTFTILQPRVLWGVEMISTCIYMYVMIHYAGIHVHMYLLPACTVYMYNVYGVGL